MLRHHINTEDEEIFSEMSEIESAAWLDIGSSMAFLKNPFVKVCFNSAVVGF